MSLLFLLLTAAFARDRDHDRIPDNDDHCPDNPGPKGGTHPGCPPEFADDSAGRAAIAAPAAPESPVGPPPRPLDEGGSCLGVIQYAVPPDVVPTSGSLLVSFHCDDLSFVDAKLPEQTATPVALTTGRRGTLTWAPQRVFVQFVGEDGGVVLPPTRAVAPTVTQAPAVAPTTVAQAARPTPAFEDLSCAGVFGGVESPMYGAKQLLFTCDGQALARYALPDGATAPDGLPAVGARATLRFTRYNPTASRGTLLFWKDMTAGAQTWKPKTLLDSLMEYGGE
jgi:hypothetical protein